MSGYDLARALEKELEPAWFAHSAQIYPELARLRERGLVRLREEPRAPRGRKPYELTEAGLAELRRWLVETEPDRAYRSELALRTFFLWVLAPDEARRLLEREAAFHRAELDRVRARDDAPAATPSAAIPYEWKLRLEQSLAEWLEWAARQPPAAGSE
jgi:DNA-binding PadR family transcriptional regulator